MLGLLGSGIAVLAVVDGLGSSAGGAWQTAAPAGSQAASTQGPASPARASRAPQSAAARAGLKLLRQAVIACQDTPYRGVQVVLWQGQGKPTTSVVDVWHKPGSVTLVRAASAPGGATSASQAGVSAHGSSATAAGYQDPDGILGVSPQLLALLAANYQVAYAGRGAAVGRPAFVVEVRRPGGAIAARIWLDASTKLPLQREIFAGNARMISEDAFTDLQLGSRGLSGMPSAGVTPWTTQLDDASLAALRTRGWPLPGKLPGNLALFAATRTSASSGQVIGLSYSDGLLVVSLFVQRGELAGPLAGWRQVTLGGRTVYAVDPDDLGDRSLAWSSNGFVYTLVADAPDTTVGQVVIALPASSPPGFWQRMGHGLRRLASWANPLRH